MSHKRTSQIAEYKGRKYRLLWSGQTKFGRRAKLQFLDGSKDFFVDESAITVLSPSATPSAGYRDGHRCRNGHAPHPGPCCNGRHGGGYDCGADCCELD